MRALIRLSVFHPLPESHPFAIRGILSPILNRHPPYRPDRSSFAGVERWKLPQYFETVLESVEALPVEDQEILVDLIRRRLIEKRRAEIASNIAETREQYRTGRVRRGTVDDLMVEIDE